MLPRTRHDTLPTKKREHFALHLFCRIAILPFPASGDPRQEFANGKLTNDGNKVAAYSSRYPANKKRESECSAFVLPYCDIAVSRKREPSARICQWQIDERRQQCCRVLVTIPLPTKKREHFALSFLLAGETRFEHATYGFGDRYSTVEPLPYQACSFYNNSKRKSRIFNCFLNFKQKIYR